jgi:hypothetical protein
VKKKVGLWIDTKKAVIVALTDKGEETGLIISKVETKPSRTGDSPLKGSFSPSQVQPDNRQQRALTAHLNIYLDAVIASIRDAESILIYGPGEAKTQLKKRLEKEKLGGLIVGIEAKDKMTNRQLASKVRKHFGL